MPPVERPHVMTIRLSDHELSLREAAELHFGGDGSAVMRQALLKLCRDEEIVPLTKEMPEPKGPGARKKKCSNLKM